MMTNVEDKTDKRSKGNEPVRNASVARAPLYEP